MNFYLKTILNNSGCFKEFLALSNLDELEARVYWDEYWSKYENGERENYDQ